MIFQQWGRFPNLKLARDNLACLGFVKKSGRGNEKTEAKCFAPVSQFCFRGLNRPTQRGGKSFFDLDRTGKFQTCIALMALEVQADHFA
jgi:hypothetical protein